MWTTCPQSFHLGFDPTGNGAIRSTIPENPTLEPNTKSIGWRVAELWPFEVFHTLTGHQTSDMQVISYSVQCCYAVHQRDNNRTIQYNSVGCCCCYIYLQAAATVLTRHDPTMQYSADVGVNSYVRVMLSFLHKQVSSLCLTIKLHGKLFIQVVWQ